MKIIPDTFLEQSCFHRYFTFIHFDIRVHIKKHVDIFDFLTE